MSYQNSHRRPVSATGWLLVQSLFVGTFVAGWFLISDNRQHEVVAAVTGRPVEPGVRLADVPAADIAPLYDDPLVVSDAELAAVLKRLVPRFSREHLRPNLVEHALRTWGASITFPGSDPISGPQMQEFLTDNSKYVASWGTESRPLLLQRDEGVSVRWADGMSGSVHHDHALAALTEAGLPLNAPLFTSARSLQLKSLLDESLRDFRLDERETEWSVLSFALWLAPQSESAWRNREGREITFDLLADRLMRGHKRDGVCLGTHRIYSLMVLLRLNEADSDRLLTESTVHRIHGYLSECRDLLIGSQSDDGSWPANWTDGTSAAELADPAAPASKRVIATGHHLEWLAIAPLEFHPPHDRILKASRWVVKTTTETPQAELDQNYTFYSHVGKALALWRHTSPAEFWNRWRTDHPDCEHWDQPPTPAESSPQADPAEDTHTP